MQTSSICVHVVSLSVEICSYIAIAFQGSKPQCPSAESNPNKCWGTIILLVRGLQQRRLPQLHLLHIYANRMWTKTIKNGILHTKVPGALSNLLYTVHIQFTHAQLMMIAFLLYIQKQRRRYPKLLNCVWIPQ